MEQRYQVTRASDHRLYPLVGLQGSPTPLSAADPVRNPCKLDTPQPGHAGNHLQSPCLHEKKILEAGYGAGRWQSVCGCGSPSGVNNPDEIYNFTKTVKPHGNYKYERILRFSRFLRRVARVFPILQNAFQEFRGTRVAIAHFGNPSTNFLRHVSLQMRIEIFCITNSYISDARNPKPFFYKGHDLSSLKVLEDGGNIFKDTAKKNNTRTADAILGDGGMNTVRLRIWVNPEYGLYGLEYNLLLAKRFQKAGYRIYLDFHFA